MKTKIQLSIIYPLAMTTLGLALLTGCQSIQDRRIHDRTDPNRASVEQTQEGYDTLGRKWNAGETPKPVEAQPQQVAPPATGTAAYLVNLVKTGPGLVEVGEPFQYELTATAAADVANVTVVDMIPAGASYVSSEPEAARDGNKLVWKFDQMSLGESKTMRVTVKAESEGQLQNCATISAVPRACASTTVGRPQLTIKKTGPEMAAVGQNITYNIVVQNTGNTPAKNVVVTDTVPDGLTSASGEKQLSFNMGDLDPGASKTAEVVLRADKRGRFCNKAVATYNGRGKVDSEACTTVVQSGVKITKTTSDKSLFINRPASYNIVVSNTGDTELSGVVVTDTAAPETVIATAEGATVNGTTATWNLGTLGAGQKKTLVVNIVSKVPGNFCDTATVVTAGGLRDSAQDCTEWKGVTGVLIEMVDDPDPIQVNEVSKFTIRVTNQGTSIDIRDLGIVATLPPELELVPNTVSDGATVNGNTITWPVVPNVAPKAAVTRTYIAKGVKAGDARSKVSVTTSMRKQPIEKFESTTVY